MGYSVTEFFGKGDPFFGGTARDLPLGKSGAFLDGGYSIRDIAIFPTREAALAAANSAPNRRAGGLISVTEEQECAGGCGARVGSVAIHYHRGLCVDCMRDAPPRESERQAVTDFIDDSDSSWWG